MKITKKELQELIQEEVLRHYKIKELQNRKTQIQEQLKKLTDEDEILEEKRNPKAKVRNRGDVVFPAGSKNVTDNEDHFPINSKTQARNALARASQFDKSPPWYKGTLKSLVTKVQSAVKNKYKDIEVTKKSATPGKG